MENKERTFKDNKYGHLLNLGSVRADLEDIKKRRVEIEKRFYAEICTVRKSQEAEEMFSRFINMVKDDIGIDLIVRRL